MPGEPRTGRGRASRERIVERAADLFAERGIAATSVDEVSSDTRSQRSCSLARRVARYAVMAILPLG